MVPFTTQKLKVATTVQLGPKVESQHFLKWSCPGCGQTHLTLLFENACVYAQECVYMCWDLSLWVWLLEGPVSGVIVFDSEKVYALKFLENDQE